MSSSCNEEPRYDGHIVRAARYPGGDLLRRGECLQQPLLQPQPHAHRLGAADGGAARARLRHVRQAQAAAARAHVRHELARDAAVEVLLAAAHPGEALEALPGEDAAHDEVTVADVQLPVHREAELLLQLGRQLHLALGQRGPGLWLGHQAARNIVGRCLFMHRIYLEIAMYGS